jgi:3'-5' exonuclease
MNHPLEHLFLMDIETVSQKEHFHLLDENWQSLWSEKIARQLPADMTPEAYYPMRAAILAEFAKVVCISFGYFKKENSQWQLRIKSLCSHNEKELLQNFITTLGQFHNQHHRWILTGHNIKEFDVPFICRRLLINQMPLSPYIDFQNWKPWETPMLDTLHLWRFGDYKHYTSLKLLAATLGITSPKDDIDGSQVGKVYWQDKDLNRISTYCQKDVATVANIILRCKSLPLLTNDQIVFVDN